MVIVLSIACSSQELPPQNDARPDGDSLDADLPRDADLPTFDADLPTEDADAPIRDADAPIRDAETLVDGDLDAPEVDAEELLDLDGDGLDDAFEAQIIEDYLPFLSIHPDDGCPRSVLVYRLRPHPEEAALLHLVVDLLFERDCGAGGHGGDNEVFGMTIDPRLAAPEGILALRAISHQGTLCEHVSDCGRCPGLRACEGAPRGGVDDFPIVYYSDGKHGAYVSESACDGACFLTNWCALAEASAEPPRVNAGEPEAPLIHDLTAAGYITAEAGWTELALLNYDPWGGEDFGGAGSVAEDLIDEAFLTTTCQL